MTLTHAASGFSLVIFNLNCGPTCPNLGSNPTTMLSISDAGTASITTVASPGTSVVYTPFTTGFSLQFSP